jgi:hypothetical protein
VRCCAEEAFYKRKPGQIELGDLLGQRQQFTQTMERESEQMQAIRNLATYARPASGDDRSRFAYVHRELFEQGNLCPYPTEQLETGSRLHDL